MNAVSFLVDTDCIIDHFNRVERVSARLEELHGTGLAISIISLAELWEGVLFSKDPRRSQAMLVEFLSTTSVLGLDAETCKTFGQIRGTLRARGRLIGDFEMLIAATALQHNLTLLSNNRKHFAQIDGLRLESLGA